VRDHLYNQKTSVVLRIRENFLNKKEENLVKAPAIVECRAASSTEVSRVSREGGGYCNYVIIDSAK